MLTAHASKPIGVGHLGGKYSEKNRPRGNRNFGDISWTKIQLIVDELLRLGQRDGRSPSAVALNWIACKGAIPMPAAKSTEQVNDLVTALGWKLAQEDEARLDVFGLTNEY